MRQQPATRRPFALSHSYFGELDEWFFDAVRPADSVGFAQHALKSGREQAQMRTCGRASLHGRDDLDVPFVLEVKKWRDVDERFELRYGRYTHRRYFAERTESLH